MPDSPFPIAGRIGIEACCAAKGSRRPHRWCRPAGIVAEVLCQPLQRRRPRGAVEQHFECGRHAGHGIRGTVQLQVAVQHGRGDLEVTIHQVESRLARDAAVAVHRLARGLDHAEPPASEEHVNALGVQRDARAARADDLSNARRRRRFCLRQSHEQQTHVLTKRATRNGMAGADDANRQTRRPPVPRQCGDGRQSSHPR